MVERLHAAGAEVWVTVTDVAEAAKARDAGADALVVQGAEAGGIEDRSSIARACRLRAAGTASAGPRGGELPLVASGGIATGAGVAAVLAAGAIAAQIGSAFMLCPEAGTSAAHRRARLGPAHRPDPSVLGTSARGIVNRWQAEQTAQAPIAYPEVHHVTAPLRAEAGRPATRTPSTSGRGSPHVLAEERPAAEIVGEARSRRAPGRRERRKKLSD